MAMDLEATYLRDILKWNWNFKADDTFGTGGPWLWKYPYLLAPDYWTREALDRAIDEYVAQVKDAISAGRESDPLPPLEGPLAAHPQTRVITRLWLLFGQDIDPTSLPVLLAPRPNIFDGTQSAEIQAAQVAHINFPFAHSEDGSQSFLASLESWVRWTLFDAEPLRALAAMLLMDARQIGEWLPCWLKDVLSKQAVRTAFVQFVIRNPGFRLYSSSSLLALERKHAFPGMEWTPDLELAIEIIKRLGRIANLQPFPQDMRPILQSGYSSAYMIAAVSEAQFVQDLIPFAGNEYASWHEGSFINLKILHKKAVTTRYRSTSIMISINDYVRGNGLHVLDGGKTALGRAQLLDQHMGSAGLTVRRLLGEVESVICPDCRSVSSAAAYLVEILKFLPGNVRTALFARRPDIANVELTCENTNIELPYIDLANEVMESYMSQLAIGRSDIEIHNTTVDDESGDLLAEPKFMLRSVYSQTPGTGPALQNSFFPFNLPYNVDLDKTRLLLKSFRTSRYNLVTIFSDPTMVPSIATATLTSNNITMLKHLQPRVIENAANAEYLGLCSGDFLAITKQAYWSEEYLAILNTGKTETGSYRDLVGVPSIAQTWGFASLEEMLDTDSSKPDNRKGLYHLQQSFLPRSGLTSSQFVSLTKTRHIGPLIHSQVSNDSIGLHLQLEASSWDRINTFLRLRLRVDMTIEELDTAVTNLDGFDATTNGMTLDFISNLVIIQKLQGLTSLDVLSILALWHPISLEGESSLYTKIFLRRNIKRLHKVFVDALADGTLKLRSRKLGDYIAGTLAAVGMSQQGYAAITQDTSAVLQHYPTWDGDQWDSFSIENLSSLYRCVVLSTASGIPQTSVGVFADVFPNVFNSPKATLSSLKQWEKLSNAGLSIEQVGYILTGKEIIVQPAAILDAAATKASQAVNSGLHALKQKFPDFSESDLTPNTVKQLASTVFADPTLGKIMDLLQGTTIQSVSGVPAGLSGSFVGSNSLPPRMKYIDGGSASGTLQIQGIVSAEVVTSAKKTFQQVVGKQQARLEALNKTIDTLQKGCVDQAGALADIILSRLFPITSMKTQFESTPLKSILISPDADVDPTQLNAKTKAFYNDLIISLRRSSQQQVIADALTETGSLDAEIISYLLNKIIKNPSVNPNGFEMLISLYISNPSETGSVTELSGYVNPPTTDDYVFVSSTEQQPLVLDGVVLSWINDGATWITAPVPMSGEKLYPVLFPSKNVQWKSKSFPVSEIPPTAIIRTNVFEKVRLVLSSIQRLSLVINAFSLLQDEIAFLNGHGEELSGITLDALSLDSLTRLADFALIRKEGMNSRNGSYALQILKWAFRASHVSSQGIFISTLDQIARQIAQFTGWDSGIITEVIPVLCQTSDLPKILARLRDDRTLTKLFALMKSIIHIGIEAKHVRDLYEWAQPTESGYIFGPDQDLNVSTSITQFARSRTNDADWTKTIEPISNQLRSHRRDALIGYLLQQNVLKDWGAVDADSLFEFFLIDVQMGNSLSTSRIKQAISTVQVFVQRAMLGLEKDQNGNSFEIDRLTWAWMSKYRVWEARRKILLFPESYISASLLDTKSSLFTTLESELRQSNITLGSAQSALRNYLYGLNDIADLRYVSSYRVGSDDDYILHLFARTKQSPYIYYYRRKKTYSGWTPWEQMQVDVPDYSSDYSNDNYNMDPSEHSSQKDHGAYLVPYVCRSRLLLFIPQLRKTEMPGHVSSSDQKPRNKTWEIQLAWTEYCSGKWSPKKILPATITDKDRDDRYLKGTHAPNPDSYLFRTESASTSSLRIEVTRLYWYSDTTTGISTTGVSRLNSVGLFLIDCDQLDTSVEASRGSGKLVDGPHDYPAFQITGKGTLLAPQQDRAWPVDDTSLLFPLVVNKATDSDPRNPSMLLLSHDSNGPREILSHSFSHALVEKAASSGTITLDSVTSISMMASTEDLGFFNHTYNGLATPYSMYNWEVGFFVPMLITECLLESQQFEDALKMLRYVFDPQAAAQAHSVSDPTNSIWGWKPFQSFADDSAEFDSILNPSDFGTWQTASFDPHFVARGRPTAYMRWVVLKYIQILLAYGDFYFRQNTLETVPQAIQCYIEASQLYGSRQEPYPEKSAPAKTFSNLLANSSTSSVGEAFALLESSFPFTPPDKSPYPAEFSWPAGDTMTSRYFCTPQNPNTMALRDTIDDRLFKIRNSMDINGNARTLALFEPAIDPGLLVRAAAAGSLNLSNVLNELDAPLVNVRFSKLVSKALNTCSDLRSFGSSLLTAKQNKDAEKLAALQAQQAMSAQRMTLDMKALALEHAKKTLSALEDSRSGPVGRLKQILRLIGESQSLVPSETEDFTGLEIDIEIPVDGDLGITSQERLALDLGISAISLKTASLIPRIIAGKTCLIPETYVVAAPMGAGAITQMGGDKVAYATETIAQVLETTGDLLDSTGEILKQKAEWKTRLMERKMRANELGDAIKDIDQQVLIQQTVVSLAAKDLKNQQAAIDSAAETERFLKNKFTNVELYTWLESSVQNIYYQTYTLAYDMAKKAEKAYRFELGSNDAPNIIDFGYWDVSHNGFLAGEQLYIGLRKLQQAYDEQSTHDFEIKKDISLRQLDPFSLYNFRATGSCTFELPETMFDMDFPGHYRRRIKSVAVNFAGIADGPISATLTLQQHRYRIVTNGSATDYLKAPDSMADGRFQSDNVPINSIAVSNDKNSSNGVFNLDFSASSYMPFENAGAISKWSLELSPFSPLDPSTVSDIVMRLNYSAVNGPATFKANTVIPAITQFIQGKTSDGKSLVSTFDLAADFPRDLWAQFAKGPADPKHRELPVTGVSKKLPFFTRSAAVAGAKKIAIQQIYLVTAFGDGGGKVSLSMLKGAKFKVMPSPAGVASGISMWVSDGAVALGAPKLPDLTLVLDGLESVLEQGIWMILKYRLQ